MYESATLEIDFLAGDHGIIPSVKSKGMYVKPENWSKNKTLRITWSIGGPKKKDIVKSILDKGEQATLVIRWRKFPLTREICLRAKNQKEFLLTADIRTPWEKRQKDLSIKIIKKRGIKILSARLFNDSLPASEAACGITVEEVDKSSWKTANIKEIALK